MTPTGSSFVEHLQLIAFVGVLLKHIKIVTDSRLHLAPSEMCKKINDYGALLCACFCALTGKAAGHILRPLCSHFAFAMALKQVAQCFIRRDMSIGLQRKLSRVVSCLSAERCSKSFSVLPLQGVPDL